MKRCAWATTEQLAHYHDHEWGVPTDDDRYLFEMICLEGAQAGLSWATVLSKRENYRRAFAHFDADALVKFNRQRRERLVTNAGLIRHAGKIDAVFANARAVIAVRRVHGSFYAFVRGFENATALSRGLKSVGFKFVGPTTCHAFMQAIGLIDDHEPGCFRRGLVSATSRVRRPR